MTRRAPLISLILLRFFFGACKRRCLASIQCIVLNGPLRALMADLDSAFAHEVFDVPERECEAEISAIQTISGLVLKYRKGLQAAHVATHADCPAQLKRG